jgi:holo-[acyl-carrier protein] synthase
MENSDNLFASVTNGIGIGIDIEDVHRFQKLDRERHEAFFSRVFTRSELEHCFSKGAASAHLAARYAGKEAVIKALGSMGTTGLAYKDIEIVNREDGAPLARVHADDSSFRVLISLSHCEDRAVAVAIVTKLA